jgi:hypothetical protein
LKQMTDRLQQGGRRGRQCVGSTTQRRQRAVVVDADQTDGLHPSSCHFNGIGDRLGNETGQSAALHSFNGRRLTMGPMLYLLRFDFVSFRFDTSVCKLIVV